MTNVLEVTDVAKSFVAKRDLLGRPTRMTDAVKGVSFTVGRAETVAVVGESGAGKSTVGRLALRLVQPDRGAVRLGDVDLLTLGRRELRSARARARMIFQDPYSSLDPAMSIGATLLEELKVHGLGDRESRRATVHELIAKVGMAPQHLARFPYEFSGGQLQRFSIARAIITNPELIVCDEPVAALDMSIRAQVVNLLRDLQDEFAIGYVFISHDLSLVRHIAHRVVVMRHGEVVESGITAQIFEDPQQPYTQTLLSAVPTIKLGRPLRTETPAELAEGRPAP